MKQIAFNIYFTVSVLFLTTGLILALTDQERQLIDNAGFLSVLLLSALNFIYAINLFFKVPE